MADIVNGGTKELLLGNEAIVRGLMEAGVRFASTYPGTPSSEIGNLLEDLAEKVGMYFEFSSNEKIALETAAAAASAGVRSFTFMKHVGLNVAADPLMTLAYSGVVGGMLVLSADDPSAHSSQNEQDNRYFATLSLLPMMEPSTPAEAKDMVPYAYTVSERLSLPLIYRTTTRVNHARSVVEFKDMIETKAIGHFVKDDRRFVNIPAFAKLNRVRLLELNRLALEISEESEWNRVEGEGDIGVITSGVSYTYVKEYMKDVSILKLGFTNPLPEKKILEFIKTKKEIIIVEELDPYLEDQVFRICAQNRLSIQIHGKRSGALPREWEYSPNVIARLNRIANVEEMPVPLPNSNVQLPNRPPTLCTGCPHRGMYSAVKKAVGDRKVVYCSDIGCYTLGVQAPFNAADFIICMGGGVGAAGGFSKSTDQKAIAFIGDSTFFHSGIAPLTSALFNDHDIITVILDNRTTAMTGHQPNPGTGRAHGGIETSPLDIGDVVKGIGIRFIRTVDPYKVGEAEAAMRDALEFKGPAVIISKCPCPLELKRRKMLVPRTCRVDQSKCIRCKICLKRIACPSLVLRGEEIQVDETQCIGCGMCADVCPKKAIEVVK